MKRLAALICALGLGMILVSCANNSATSEAIPNSDAGAVLTNPVDYNGREITIEGAVFDKATDSGGTTLWLAYHDAEQLSQPFAFTIPAEFSVTTGEYVRVEGKVAGETSDLSGAATAELTTPLLVIDGTNAEVLNAWDGMSPTVDESTVDHDIS